MNKASDEGSSHIALFCKVASWPASIFYGDKLLTTANNDTIDDLALIEDAGLQVQPGSL